MLISGQARREKAQRGTVPGITVGVAVVIGVALVLAAACSASPDPSSAGEAGSETAGAEGESTPGALDDPGGSGSAGTDSDAGDAADDRSGGGADDGAAADDPAAGGVTGLAKAPRPSHEPAPVPPWPGTAYTDDDGHPDEAWIEALHTETVVFGCGDGNFCPDEPIAMAHLAELLYNLRFRSPDGHERPAVDRALGDIAAVCRQGPSCFDQRVTAGQLALILVRAFDLPPTAAAAAADRFDDIDGHPAAQAIGTVAAAGILTGCDETSFCPDRLVTRSQAAAALMRALGLPPIAPRPVPWQLELVVGELEDGGGTTDLRAPAGDDRLFVTLKGGTIRIVAGGVMSDAPFLDITDQVRNDHSERGLLSVVFHPSYDGNGRFFVFFTDLNGDGRIVEYRADPADPDRADPASARPIITIPRGQYLPNHQGGNLQFGPDGMLYIAVGEAGWYNDWPRNGQNPHTLEGTLLRIDVDRPGDGTAPYGIPPDNPFADGVGGRPEVWAYGLRNPWRFSFDGENIYIGDVGHEHREEVSVAAASAGGLNYGWSLFEGTSCFRGTGCDAAGLVRPAVEYGRDDGVGVIGGYVYRGDAIPQMRGHYFYADFTGGWVRTFRWSGGEATEHYDWSRAIERPESARFSWSFGVDGHGELYLLTRWAIWRIAPTPTS